MEKPEGLVWGLSELGGCTESYSPETGTLISVPKNFIKDLDLIRAGDMVSWKGLWHRVYDVKYDDNTEVMTVAIV